MAHNFEQANEQFQAIEKRLAALEERLKALEEKLSERGRDLEFEKSHPGSFGQFAEAGVKIQPVRE